MNTHDLRTQYETEFDEPAVKQEPIVEIDYVCWLERKVIELEAKLQQQELNKVIEGMPKENVVKEMFREIMPDVKFTEFENHKDKRWKNKA